jgi:DNA-binding MarR family transcriptional regulator
MSKKIIASVDLDSGEILEGVPVWFAGQKKTAFTKLYDKRWFIMAQDALVILAKDKDLTLEPKNVLLYLLSQLDFENFMHVPQVEIAETLGMDKSKVSKAIKLLTEKGILIRGPKQARSSSFRLNPNFGYKGNPSGKVYRTKDGRREFRVVDDGGYVVPATGTEAKEAPDQEPA